MKTLMKMLQIFLIFLVISLILFIVAIQFIKIDKYKHLIENYLTEEVARPVTIDHISLKFSWSKGMQLLLSNFEIDQMVRVETSSITFDIQAYLKNKVMIIKDIQLVRPKIYINPSQWSSGEADQKQRPEFKSNAHADHQISESADVPSDQIEVRIQSISIQDGVLLYEDNSGEKSIQFRLKDIQADMRHFVFDQFVPVTIKAALWSDTSNLDIKTDIQLSSQTETWQARNVNIRLPLGSMVIRHVMDVSDDLVVLKDLDYLRGDLTVEIPTIKSTHLTLQDLRAQMVIQNGALKWSTLKAPFKDLEVQVDFNEADLFLNRFQFVLAEGSGSIQGQVKNLDSIPVFQIQSSLEGMALSESVDQSAWPYPVTGKVQLTLDASGNGWTENQIASSLQGKGLVSLEDGQVIGFNILKEILNKLSFAPGLVENISVRYQDKLNRENTWIEQAQADFSIAAENLVVTRSQLTTEGFTYLMRGHISRALSADIQSSVLLSKALTQELLKEAAEFQYFLNQDQQIAFPLRRYQGPVERFKTYPDMEDILKKAVRKKAQEEAKKAIFKALDVDIKQNLTEQQEGEAQPSSEQIIIENVLDSLGIFN